MITSEEPINLLEEGISLHVAPSVGSAFDWQFSKVLFTVEIIKGEHILNTTTRFVTIIRRTNVIKVAKNKPIFRRRDIKIK